MTDKKIYTDASPTWTIQNSRDVHASLGPTAPTCGHSVQLRFYNYLGEPVTVVTRDGLPFKIPPQNNPDGYLYIVRTYSFKNSTEVDPDGVYNFYSQDDPEENVLSNLSYNHRNRPRSPNGWPNITPHFSLQHRISRKQLYSKSGSVYVPELDYLITLSHRARDELHPYSATDIRRKLLHLDDDVNSRDRFSFTIFIVSNDKSVGDRYFNLFGEVYLVPSIQRTDLKDGVYVARSSPYLGEGEALPTTEVLDFETGLSHYRLYRTPEEAKTHGDDETAHKQYINKLKRQLEEEAQKRQQEEEKARRERLEFEREINQQKQENQREKEAFQREEQRRQERLNRQRARADTLKTATTIVSSLITLTVLVMKQRG